MQFTPLDEVAPVKRSTGGIMVRN